jgi:hypothetical protein
MNEECVSMAKVKIQRRHTGCVILLSALLSTLGALPVAAQAQSNDPDAARAGQLESVLLRRTVSGATTNKVLQIPASADTYVTSNKPDVNWGGESSLYVGYDLLEAGNGAERTLLFFDLSGLVPTGAVINQAYIELYQYALKPIGDQPMGNIVRHLNSSWNALEVTWNNHEPGWDGISEEGQIAAEVGWQQFPITELVKEWMNGTTPNYGVIIIGDERVQERERIFYSLNAGNEMYPRLVIDFTVNVDTTAPIVTVDHLPQYVAANFNVTWSGTDSGGSGIDYYDVQYMIPGQGWQNWQMHTRDDSATFYGGQNGVTYEFRARGVDNAGNVQPFGDAQAETIVDGVAPYAAVDALAQYSFYSAFDVTWHGSDNPGGSGLAYYDVQYRLDGGSWRNWHLNVSDTGAQFTGAQDSAFYEFRARAVDNVGNAQPFGDPQAATTVETAPPTSTILPFPASIVHNSGFFVYWSGQAEPGKTILYYDVQYRFNDGAWVMWQQQTQATSALFNALQGDGIYGFEVRASDNYGAIEAFVDRSEGTVVLDAESPFIVVHAWIPVMGKVW